MKKVLFTGGSLTGMLRRMTLLVAFFSLATIWGTDLSAQTYVDNGTAEIILSTQIKQHHIEADYAEDSGDAQQIAIAQVRLQFMQLTHRMVANGVSVETALVESANTFSGNSTGTLSAIELPAGLGKSDIQTVQNEVSALLEQ